jgi:hypothetical protein
MEARAKEATAGSGMRLGRRRDFRGPWGR